MSNESQQNVLGANIARFRREQKMSGDELAERAGNGLTRSVIANLENGRKSDVTLSQLIALGFALSVSPANLAFNLEEPYASVDIPNGRDSRVTLPAWLAYGWFSGQYNATEVHEVMDPSQPKPFWVFETTPLIFFNLKERDRLLAHETALEEQLRAVRDEGPPEMPNRFERASWYRQELGEEANLTQRLTSVRADLYSIEKQLRQLHANLNASHIGPGSPF